MFSSVSQALKFTTNYFSEKSLHPVMGMTTPFQLYNQRLNNFNGQSGIKRNHIPVFSRAIS